MSVSTTLLDTVHYRYPMAEEPAVKALSSVIDEMTESFAAARSIVKKALARQAM